MGSPFTPMYTRSSTRTAPSRGAKIPTPGPRVSAAWASVARSAAERARATNTVSASAVGALWPDASAAAAVSGAGTAPAEAGTTATAVSGTGCAPPVAGTPTATSTGRRGL